jgi:hypothetical protein
MRKTTITLAAVAAAGAILALPAIGSAHAPPEGCTGTLENPICPPPPPPPPPPTPPTVVPPPVPLPEPVVVPPPITPVTPPPVTRRPPQNRSKPFCERPAKLRIVQQQKGTLYTETYPLKVIIGNTTGAVVPRGALILSDAGLQNFVTRSGSRVERLVVPVGPMRKGQVREVDREMGFVGPAAYLKVFTTYAKFVVKGRVCGYALDRAFEDDPV